MKTYKWYTVILMLAGLAAGVVLLAGCGSSADQSEAESLYATVAALETTQADQLEWISYQATQIGENRELINRLGANHPEDVRTGKFTPTPYVNPALTGAVEIEDGMCCVGGTEGDTMSVAVQFEASSPNGEVTEMRVVTGGRAANLAEMQNVPWEPYVQEKMVPVDISTNWTSFWVSVQYRDEAGNISEIMSDDIGVEGEPQTPTETPTPTS